LVDFYLRVVFILQNITRFTNYFSIDAKKTLGGRFDRPKFFSLKNEL